MASVPNWAKSAANWTKENPGTAACAVVGAGGLAVVAAPALVTAPLLSAAGFGANGIVGGTAASAIQASIGNFVAQSAFAVCQSAAMGGYGAATVAAVGQGAGAATAVAGGGTAAWKWWKGKGKKDGQDEKGAVEGGDEGGGW
ncbi:hypothetical protein B0T22DRAFT_478760 [Podospora appendiculata]|uniref:Uncharacterized protein n=1 Tax=Podospora appendiculata TaxID=314037 RepID=A0AAE1CBG3_9PEZI|nr:hypothetical protein B0T22DRAFT_478760 [Podospora appendiculata]